MHTLSTFQNSLDAHGLHAIGLLLLWSTSLLGTAWLIAALLRRKSPAVRYCVWQFAMSGLLVLPSVFLLLPGVPLGLSLPGTDSTIPLAEATPPASDPPAWISPRAAGTDALSPLDGEPRGPVTPPSARPAPRELAAQAERPAAPAERMGEAGLREASAVVNRDEPRSIRWSWIVVGLWALGTAVQFVWLAFCMRRARRLILRAAPVSDPGVEIIRSELERELGLSRRVPLLTSAELRGPIMVGVFRPHILLPTDCARWPAKKMRLVLLHELAHVARRDVFWQLMARGATAAYWFHPLAWLALRRMRQERERACDDRVLLVGVGAVEYAAGLVEFAAGLAGRPQRSLGGVALAEQLPLEDRVRSILNPTSPRNPASAAMRAALLAVVAGLVLTLGAMRPFSPVPKALAGPPPEEAAGTDSDKANGKNVDRKAPQTTAAEAAPPAKSEPTAEEPAPDEPKQIPSKGSMRVRVIGPDGQAIAGAKLFANVSFWNRNAKLNKQWVIKNKHYVTDGDGMAEIELPKIVEDLRLWARKDGYAPMFAMWWPKLEPGLTAIPEEFTYHMQKGTVLGGVVKNDDGRPIEGVEVDVRYDENGVQSGPTNRAGFDSWLANDGNVRTDAQGRWSLDNVPAGDDVKVSIKLSHPDYIDDKDWGSLQKEQLVTTQALRDQTAVIVMHRGVVVSGTVTGADGNPLPGALVIRGDRPYWDEGSQEVRTDADGRYQLPSLPPDPMHLTVVAEGWMPEWRAIQISASLPPLDFNLQPGKKLRIRFVDEAGNAVPRVSVAIQEWHGGESLYNVVHSNVLATNIPRTSDDNGIYEWTWAPDSPVKYSFGRQGFAAVEASITADDQEHVVTLPQPLRIAGTVVDANTGQPLAQFTQVPILNFRENFPLLDRPNAVQRTGGKLNFELIHTGAKRSLQIEAPGYASVRVGPFAVGMKVPPLAVRLTPAEPFVGRVVIDAGQGVADARVYVGSYTEHLYLNDLDAEDGSRSSNYVVHTNDQGEFEIAHQLERYSLFVVSDQGYGEAERAVGKRPGTVKLRRWAKVRGRLLQAGKPMANCNVQLDPIRDSGGDAPRGDVRFYTATDQDGSFVFERVPPVPSRVKAYLHWSVDGPLSSSRSVPIAPSPGEEITVNLGGGGAELTGRLALDPPAAADFDYHFGLNYLVARRPGIAPPETVADDGFDWRNGWSDAWASSNEGAVYLWTLHHWFVKPEADGRFRISGVEPGEYDLAFRLYGSTEGCLVHPVAMVVVPVTVREGQTTLDLGTIKVPAVPGVNVGDPAPDWTFTGLDGRQHGLNESRGKHVLIDFWASWCSPCVAKLPEVEALRKQYATQPGLVVLGANLDQQPARAERLLRRYKLPWQHALLGDWSATDVPKRFGVASVPTYVLIGPDGRVAARSSSTAPLVEILEKAASGPASR